MKWSTVAMWLGWWTALAVVATGFGAMALVLFLFGSGLSAFLAARKE